MKEESKIFDVSENTVYKWEHNLNVPRKSVLKKIAYFYSIPFEWLLHGDTVEAEENSEYTVFILNREDERELIEMFTRLPNIKRYKIIKYAERILVGHKIIGAQKILLTAEEKALAGLIASHCKNGGKFQ